MKIIGVGDCVLDEYVTQERLYPGGNSVNVPVLAKRAGADSAAYIGILGSDESSKQFSSFLRDEQIDVSRVRYVDGIMARNYISLDEQGDRSFVGNNGSEVAQKMFWLQLNEKDLEVIKRYDVLHTSYHSEIDEIIPKVLGKVAISLDFSDAYTESAIRRYCSGLDFVFLSAGSFDEAYTVSCANLALEVGANVVVLTHGLDGSTIFTKSGIHHEDAVKISALDALGAGDAYIASFLEAFYSSDGNIQSAAKRASEFAAQNCLHHGATGVFFTV